MLAVVTALKVLKHGMQGNITFEVVCRQPFNRQRSQFDLSFCGFAVSSPLFGGEHPLSLLLPMNMRSVVTPYVPVSTGSIIGLQVIIASYRVA